MSFFKSPHWQYSVVGTHAFSVNRPMDEKNDYTFRVMCLVMLCHLWMMSIGDLRPCMEKMRIPGKFCFWRKIFAILRGNSSFRCFLCVFFFQKCIKNGNKFTFWTQFLTIFQGNFAFFPALSATAWFGLDFLFFIWTACLSACPGPASLAPG